MKTSLSKKYKDRDPIETINIIRNFFKEKNCIVEEEVQSTSMIDTYWCGLSLYFNGEKLCYANGKGISKEYALASGYSELYERFTGFGPLTSDFFLNYFIKQNNYKKYGYFENKNEQYEDYKDVINCCEKFKEFFSKTFDDNNYLSKIFTLLLNNEAKYKDKIVTIPFYSFNDESQIKYFSNDLINVIQGSSGLCAGNTLEEALNQGMAECYEHYVGSQIFNTNQEFYYELNLNYLNLEENIINKIKSLKDLGYTIQIFDLSYNFNVPVIMTLLTDRSNHVQYANLGSSPIINIAIERTITEMYQGFFQLNEMQKKIMLPSNGVRHLEAMRLSPNTFQSGIVYPEAFSINKIIVNEYNKEVFLPPQDYSNIEIKNHLQKLNKINNFNVYYTDLSLSDEIFSARIFIDNIEIYDQRLIGSGQLDQKYRYDLNKYYELSYNIYKIYLDLLTNKSTDKEYIDELIDRIIAMLQNKSYLMKNININFDGYLDVLPGFAYKTPWVFPDIDNAQNFYDYFYKQDKFYGMDNYKFYQLIYLYCINNYSYQTIKTIMKNLGFNVENLKNIIDNKLYLNLNYLFQNIILQPLKDFYSENNVLLYFNLYKKESKE